MRRSMLPDVSVVIPCWNAASTIGLQLEALDAQEDAVPFEVLIVDNRSEDGTRDIAARFAEHASFRLRIIDADEAQGASYARNVGVTHARAERLMFCDADDIVSRRWVDHGNRTFEHADLWSGSAVLLTDAQSSGTLEEIRSTFESNDEWMPPVDEQKGAFPVLMGGNFGATQQAFRAIGGFDQSLPSAGEDNDFAFRARQAGFAVPVAKTVRIGYRGTWDAGFRRRLAYRSARAHALIATRYQAWEHSPYPSWFTELVRCVGAGVKMLVGPRTRDREGLLLRSSAALGLADGVWRYRVLRKMPTPAIGAGLRSAESSRRAVP